MGFDTNDWTLDTRSSVKIAPLEEAQKYIDVKFKSTFHQVVKDTKYIISDFRVNEEIEFNYHLVLSTADNPVFRLYDSNDSLIGTFTLINAGNTDSVTGCGNIVKLPNGYVVNLYYTYIKNGTPYHENQNGFITTKPSKISFGADNGYTYTSQSYVKITQK